MWMPSGAEALAAAVLAAGPPAVAGAWVRRRARAHEARAEAAHPPEGHMLDIGGHRVHAVTMGTGPDLVLIHGASGNARDMTHALAPRLAARYRVIALDRPGLGYSDRIDPGGATIVQQADLLARAAAELGAPRPIVLGHSYGGAVALAWAVHWPDRMAALVPVAAPSHPWKGPLPWLYRITAHPVLGPLAIPALTAFVQDSLVERQIRAIFAPDPVPQGYIAHIGAGLTLRRHTLRANARQRAGLKAEITRLHHHYPEIAVPTEIVHGTADTTVGLDIHARQLVRDIPGARLARLPRVGHMPHHAAPDAVIAAVDRAAVRAGHARATPLEAPPAPD